MFMTMASVSSFGQLIIPVGYLMIWQDIDVYCLNLFKILDFSIYKYIYIDILYILVSCWTGTLGGLGPWYQLSSAPQAGREQET